MLHKLFYTYQKFKDNNLINYEKFMYTVSCWRYKCF